MSRWTARSQARQRFFTTAATSAIALLFPRVGVVVVAARLPEAGLVVAHELEAGDPLRALPEVEVGHEAAHRRAVLERERLLVQAVRHERVLARRLGERHVRHEAVPRLEDDEP